VLIELRVFVLFKLNDVKFTSRATKRLC